MDEKDFERAFASKAEDWTEHQRRLYFHFSSLNKVIQDRDIEINRLREAIVNSFVCENTPSASDCPVCNE